PQEDYMRAVTGDDDEAWKYCKALFLCGTPYGQELGTELMRGDLNAARKAIEAAGYAGEKVVVLNPADITSISPFGHVIYDYFQKQGLNAEFVDTDLGTLVRRGNSKAAPDQGGWSLFYSWWNATTIAHTAISSVQRGLGD